MTRFKLNYTLDVQQAKGEQNSLTTKQAGQHSTGVVTSLHNTLKKTTAEFMGVVKTRQSVSRHAC
jgi:hypothetical protein